MSYEGERDLLRSNKYHINQTCNWGSVVLGDAQGKQAQVNVDRCCRNFTRMKLWDYSGKILFDSFKVHNDDKLRLTYD